MRVDEIWDERESKPGKGESVEIVDGNIYQDWDVVMGTRKGKHTVEVIKIKRMNRFVVALALLLMTLTSFSASVAAFDIEDPQTAERKWATPNLEKIQENYDGPKLSKDEAGETTILITFILHPSGRIQDLKAVKQSGGFYNKSDISKKKFNAIQKGLVKAIKKSEPLYYRKRPHEAKIPWGVLSVYCPKEYQFARMIHVARGKDGVWGERKRGKQQ